MRKLNTMLAMLAAIILPVTSAHAAITFWQANLSGLNEVPANPSPGTGIAFLQFDDSTNVLSLTSGFYSNMLGNVTVSHVHAAPAGLNGGAFIDLTNTGGTFGNLTGGSGVLTAAQVVALFNAGLYVNVHTTVIPGGEIRGQILAVPAPGALALLGLAGLIAPRRRRA